MVVINVAHIFFPLFFIFCFIGGWYPDTKDVVDVAFVDEKVGGVFWEDSVFVDGEEQIGIC